MYPHDQHGDYRSPLIFKGGGVAKRLECWTCNPKDTSSRPTLIASWICFTENLSFKSSATVVNSQLVCLRPVAILNPVMFNLYVNLIIYNMALKSSDGELSLEVVFCIFFLKAQCCFLVYLFFLQSARTYLERYMDQFKDCKLKVFNTISKLVQQV